MRLGIYGGSFDPVHLGHLTLARCCAEQARLDELWFVPAAQQPLKPSGPRATEQQRLDMLELALENQPGISISKLEIERGGVSYTVDTLRAIQQQQQPEATLFFLMGADSLAEMPHWHQPAEICNLATLLVVRRAGMPEPDFGVLETMVSEERLQEIVAAQVEMPEVPISSSGIRALVATSGHWQAMVPEKVADYIEQLGLYRG